MMRWLLCVLTVFHILEPGGPWTLPKQSHHRKETSFQVIRDGHDKTKGEGAGIPDNDLHTTFKGKNAFQYSVKGKRTTVPGSNQGIHSDNTEKGILQDQSQKRLKRHVRSTNKFLGFVVGASSNSKIKASIKKLLLDIEKSIWDGQSLVTKPYNMGEDKVATIRGTFPADVVTNFHGKPEEAKYRRSKGYVVRDVNSLTTLFILQCLIEATLYGAAPSPNASNLTLAVTALDEFHSHLYPKGSSVLSTWPEVVLNNGEGFQLNPSNLLQAKIKDGSTYGQLQAITSQCADECPQLKKGLKSIQSIGVCKQYFGMSLAALVKKKGAALDFMTSLSNMALGSLLHAVRSTDPPGKLSEPIFPGELKEWNIANSEVGNLVILLKKSIIRIKVPPGLVRATTQLPSPTSSPTSSSSFIPVITTVKTTLSSTETSSSTSSPTSSSSPSSSSLSSSSSSTSQPPPTTLLTTSTNLPLTSISSPSSLSSSSTKSSSSLLPSSSSPTTLSPSTSSTSTPMPSSSLSHTKPPSLSDTPVSNNTAHNRSLFSTITTISPTTSSTTTLTTNTLTTTAPNTTVSPSGDSLSSVSLSRPNLSTTSSQSSPLSSLTSPKPSSSSSAQPSPSISSQALPPSSSSTTKTIVSSPPRQQQISSSSYQTELTSLTTSSSSSPSTKTTTTPAPTTTKTLPQSSPKEEQQETTTDYEIRNTNTEDPSETNEDNNDDNNDGRSDNKNDDKDDNDNDDNQEVHVDIHIRVTVDTGDNDDDNEKNSEAQEKTTEIKTEQVDVSADSKTSRGVLRDEVMKAVKNATAKLAIEIENNRETNLNGSSTAADHPPKDARTTNVNVRGVVKDSDGRVIANISRSSDFNGVLTEEDGEANLNYNDENSGDNNYNNTSSNLGLPTKALNLIIDILFPKKTDKSLTDVDNKTHTTTNTPVAASTTLHTSTPAPNTLSQAKTTTSSISSSLSSPPQITTTSPTTTLTSTTTTTPTSASSLETSKRPQSTSASLSPSSSSLPSTKRATTTASKTTSLPPTTSSTKITTLPLATKTTTTSKTTMTTNKTPVESVSPTIVDRTMKPLGVADDVGKEPEVIDSMTYFGIHKFLEEEIEHNRRDVFLIPTWITRSKEALMDLYEISEEEGEKKGEGEDTNHRSPIPPQDDMSAQPHEVDLTLTAAGLHAILISSVTGLVDIQNDHNLQSIFCSSLRMLTWFLNHQDDLITMVTLSHFPSRYQLFWMASRIAFQFNLAPVKKSNMFDFAKDEISSFTECMRHQMTLSILSSIKDGGLGPDGQTRVYLDDFIGVADLDDKGKNKVNGDDRLFSSAMAANSLISTWSSPTFTSGGLMQFHKDTPDAVRIAVNSLVNYISRAVTNPDTPTTNAYVSDSFKSCETLPPWFPYNSVTSQTGEDIQPSKASLALNFGVKGYIPAEEYAQEMKKKRFKISLPEDKILRDLNSPSSIFRFWSSKELTRAVCLLAIAQAADLKVDDNLGG